MVGMDFWCFDVVAMAFLCFYCMQLPWHSVVIAMAFWCSNVAAIIVVCYVFM